MELITNIKERLKQIGLYSNFLPECSYIKKRKNKETKIYCEIFPKAGYDFEVIRGFPNTIIDPIDEASVLLKELYENIIENPEYFKIWAFHLPQRGDETNLFYWHSLKAKAYLDLQALLIKNAKIGFAKKNMESPNIINRIFIFPKEHHIEELTLNAFMVIYEQLNIGIDCSYTILEWFEKKGDPFILDGDLLLISERDGSNLYLIRVEAFDFNREIPYGTKFCTCYEKGWDDIPGYHSKYIKNIFRKRENGKLELVDFFNKKLCNFKNFKFDDQRAILKWKIEQRVKWKELMNKDIIQ